MNSGIKVEKSFIFILIMKMKLFWFTEDLPDVYMTVVFRFYEIDYSKL